MRLTDREVEMIRRIPKRRRDRKLGAWLGLAAAVAVFGLFQAFGSQYELLGPLIGVLLGFSTAEVARAHFRVEPEDKLIELLQKYVSRDPEAVRQVSMRVGSGGKAA